MKNDTIKLSKQEKIEFYELVLKYSKKHSFKPGICYNMYQLYLDNIIPFEGYEGLLDDLWKRKPTNRNRYKKFANHKSFTNEEWFWELSDSGNKQRILFLKTIIKELKSKIK